MQLYSRKLLSQIEECLPIPEVIVIHGARQTGKTTLLRLVMEKLKETVLPSNTVYFDLEDFELMNLCNAGVKAVMEHLKGISCDFSHRIYLFIDEIQYLDNPSSFLKYFFDHYKESVKLIISGSSTFAIKSKFKESLVGRTVDFELFGLDFDEFLVFKNVRYDIMTADPIVIEELRKLFREYVYYGSYPRIVLENSIQIKERLLKQVITTYLKRDIRDLAKINNIASFDKLLKILAIQSGSLLNILELANTVGMARETVENYLALLENTYIIHLVRPFHKNIRSELTKMPKIYFEDLGIKTLLEKGSFPQKLEGEDIETAVYGIFRKNLNVEKLHFWRTAQKEEIDFIIENQEKLLVYEVKLNARNKDRLVLEKFKSHYASAQTYLVGIHFIDKGNPLVPFIYPWQILSTRVC